VSGGQSVGVEIGNDAVQKVDAKSPNCVLSEGAKIFTVQEKSKINKN